jgi:REP element-mobilizing transposase RayT
MTQRRIYQDEYPYFVTFNTLGGEPWFEEEKYAELLARIIFETGEMKGYKILSYQIMPNHVHLLVGKRTLESVRLEDDKNVNSIDNSAERTFSKVRDPKKQRTHAISDLMQSIKGNFSYKHKLGLIWQSRFHTRIVNTPKYLATITKYIQENPVKEGLSKMYSKSPYQFFDWYKIQNLF